MCRKARTRWVGIAEPLIPTATPSSLPWETARERATSRQGLYFERLGYWERLPPFGECPLPSPPPRGRGQVAADSSITGRLKKNARNINSRNFSGSLLSQGRWNKRRERFFRRPLNPSVGCVPQGTRAVGWGCRENRERVRTAHALHAGYGLLYRFYQFI